MKKKIEKHININNWQGCSFDPGPTRALRASLFYVFFGYRQALQVDLERQAAGLGPRFGGPLAHQSPQNDRCQRHGGALGQWLRVWPVGRNAEA